MKKQLLAAIFVLLFAGFACSIQNLQMETSEMRTVEISEQLPENLNETDILFQMSGGEFVLKPGAQNLVNGMIVYNIDQWEPEFTRSENKYQIKQTNPLKITGIPSDETINRWELALSTAVPINLTIEGGASDNIFDLTGLQINNLSIVQGASETTLLFDQPNPVRMETLSFTTGASSAKLFGLANANFNAMSFSGGAGNYTLDFTGNLTQDTFVELKAGASNIKIIIPAGMRAQVNNLSSVSVFNTEGTWLLTNDTYTTLEEGYLLTINLNLTVGNVTLIHGE
jgi:hypothetical protein